MLFQFVHALRDDDGYRVGLFTRGTAGYPDSQVTVLSFAFQELLQLCFQSFKGVRVAEEAGDADEQVLQQCLRFSFIALQETRIFGNIVI